MSNENSEEQNYHFFASTAWEWKTAPDPYTPLKGVLESSHAKRMNKLLRHEYGRSGLFVSLIRVPLPPTATYSISEYEPQVEGCEVVWEGRI